MFDPLEDEPGILTTAFDFAKGMKAMMAGGASRNKQEVSLHLPGFCHDPVGRCRVLKLRWRVLAVAREGSDCVPADDHRRRPQGSFKQVCLEVVHGRCHDAMIAPMALMRQCVADHGTHSIAGGTVVPERASGRWNRRRCSG